MTTIVTGLRSGSSLNASQPFSANMQRCSVVSGRSRIRPWQRCRSSSLTTEHADGFPIHHRWYSSRTGVSKWYIPLREVSGELAVVRLRFRLSPEPEDRSAAYSHRFEARGLRSSLTLTARNMIERREGEGHQENCLAKRCQVLDQKPGTIFLLCPF